MTRIAIHWLLLSTLAIGAANASPKITYNRDVRPILSEHCFACHGFDENKREADLRLDTPEGASADLGGYQAIVAGSPASSELWKRIISSDSESVMPPPDFHKPLTDSQKEVLRQWIQQGAKYERHWAFVAPRKPTVPNVNGVLNPIDAFLQQKLAAKGLQPSNEADKATLIRRVTLDLDTLVVFGGEFGRTVYCQGKLANETYGRDHHPRNFCMWMAGGGIKAGQTYGETDDFSYNVTENGVHLNDLNATILHCMGIDDRRFSFPFQGLQQRLTGVEDTRIVNDILA